MDNSEIEPPKEAEIVEEQAASPLPEKTEPINIPVRQETMDFPEAMRAVIQGAKIRREEWPEEAFGYLGTNDELLVNPTGGKDHSWIVARADMEADDWVTI